jgi:aspartyl-tRNA(Asn)/glutamyl-tRNA(Gln) amidotransferase subunit A
MLTDSQLAFASISQIAKLYRTRKLSPVELTRFLLDRIDKLNPRLNAYITVCAELALKQAATAENELSKGNGRSPRRDRGPLHGIPISLKDNIYTAGVRTTAGSQILRDFVPKQDAPVGTALQQAGAVILGKTNMHEFAYGATNINPHFGSTRNPWDLDRITGGSSGGSAAAVAAGLCYGSIGTDTGGSIRIPASLCGLVGLKPSLGSVSTKNVVPLSPSLDVVGPLARCASDAALLFEVIRTSSIPYPLSKSLKVNSSRARKLRLGIPKEFFFDILSPEVAAAFDSAVKLLRKHDAQFKKVSLPLIEQSEDAGNQIAWPEALLYHQQSGWYPNRASQYGEDIRTRLDMGTKVTAVTYLQALQTRDRFHAEFQAVLAGENLDALIVPTTPVTAPLLDEESISINHASYPTRAILLRLNRPANLAGVPAISVPSGMTSNGLPIGLQLIGPLLSEPLLLLLASHFEQILPGTSQVPLGLSPAST